MTEVLVHQRLCNLYQHVTTIRNYVLALECICKCIKCCQNVIGTKYPSFVSLVILTSLTMAFSYAFWSSEVGHQGHFASICQQLNVFLFTGDKYRSKKENKGKNVIVLRVIEKEHAGNHFSEFEIYICKLRQGVL